MTKMKKIANYMKKGIMTMSVLLMVSAIMAQPGYGPGNGYRRGFDNPPDSRSFCWRIPDITEEQNSQIQDLRTDHLKTMRPFRNEIREQRAQLRTLETADSPDMSKINNTIDNISGIQNKMHKTRASHIQDIRKILTEEQRVYFDTHRARRGRRIGRQGHWNGPRAGRGRGMGPGNGCGW